ncbi:MAG: hypothetical protein WAW06_01005 [bacterium]
MRRHPLALFSFVGALAIYFLVREAGHLAACLVQRMPVSVILRYGFLPSVQAQPEAAEASTRAAAAVILAGPAATLAAGYVLLYGIVRRWPEAFPRLRILWAVTCYVGLMLDPIYYAVIPLMSLGGEPGTLTALTGVGFLRIEIAGFALLVANTLLARRIIAPFLREHLKD